MSSSRVPYRLRRFATCLCKAGCVLTNADATASGFRGHSITTGGQSLILAGCRALTRAQMKIAHGVVKLWKEAGHSALHAEFNIAGESPMHFIGRFNPPVEEFECHDATLAYASQDALTASHKFYGKLGTSDIFIAIADSDGPIIEGQLAQSLNPASRVVGFGTWFENVSGNLRSVIFGPATWKHD